MLPFQNAPSGSTMPIETPKTPEKIAPTASRTSGMVITLGDSCTFAMTSSLARGAPWKVMNSSRHE